MKVVQLTQKDVQVGPIIALYSADNAVKSIDSAKYTILYSAANGYFWYNSARYNYFILLKIDAIFEKYV